MILAFKFLLFAILAAQFIDCEPQTRTIDVVTITWENIGARTIFNITANLSSKNIDPNNAWVAVGINTEKNMVRVCKIFKYCMTKIRKLIEKIIIFIGWYKRGSMPEHTKCSIS